MARQASAGELRTRIYVLDRAELPQETDSIGNRSCDTSGLLERGRRFWCKWVNAYGNEVYAARQAQVQEPATLTLRYTPYITPTCLLCRRGDRVYFEVISVNDVENRHAWLEVKVQRNMSGR